MSLPIPLHLLAAIAALAAIQGQLATNLVMNDLQITEQEEILPISERLRSLHGNSSQTFLEMAVL
jgi:hypothetical protein